MANKLLAVPCLLLAVVLTMAAWADDDVQSTYIVHVAPRHAPRSKSRLRLLADEYPAFLRSSLPDHMLRPEPTVHYSYVQAATGFAARLTRRQAKHLASLPSVLAVVPDGELRLQTTRTPAFLGLSESSALMKASKGGAGIVVGIIDSGIYPRGRASFGALPPGTSRPWSWFHGSCVTTPTFNATEYCNSRLVGAKFFYKGYEAKRGRAMDENDKSPLDTNGHGTHIASTIAGAPVDDASFFGYARGKAVGVAPLARIAVYKACWTDSCTDSDVLAAFDEAMHDMVHVISVSLGGGEGPHAPELHNDTIAKAAFRAVRRRITVVAAAGNGGPGESTVQNVAPWVISVGASTIDRQFVANVVLGNGKTITGFSLHTGAPLGATQIPLIHGGSCQDEDDLDPDKVKGSIVLCDPVDSVGKMFQGDVVRRAGGAGAILGNSLQDGSEIKAEPHRIPATTVSYFNFLAIWSYISKERGSATATILSLGTVLGQKKPSSPRVASFSSRGPNIRAPGILKPDVIAPGVEILAAWTGEASPTDFDDDKRRVEFNIIGGTSMACPHVSGIVALLQEAKWVRMSSPAMIKSALMTTAYNRDNTGDIIKEAFDPKTPSTPFVHGAGHVDPNRALDPGLVYDVWLSEHIGFLCSLGYTAKQIALFTKDDSTDCSNYQVQDVTDTNHPAFAVVFKSNRDKVTQRRRLSNVGNSYDVTYLVHITSPEGVRVVVNPSKLAFTRESNKLTYEVTFEPTEGRNVNDKYTFGSIMWSDGMHKVTSPIAITWPVSGDELAAI